jgi:hypothetical protein
MVGKWWLELVGGGVSCDDGESELARELMAVTSSLLNGKFIRQAAVIEWDVMRLPLRGGVATPGQPLVDVICLEVAE